jgi:cytochrome P450 monooxygenase-3
MANDGRVPKGRQFSDTMNAKGKARAAKIRMQYPDTPFVVPTKPARVVLPMSLLEEVAHAPDEKISSMEVFRQQFLGRFTKIGENRPELFHTIRVDLTKNIGAILPVLQAESSYAIDVELGSPNDWTAIMLYPKILRLVALLSGRVFVGLPLSRNEEWLKMSIEYTMDVMGVQMAAGKWQPMLQPLVARFMPEVRKARQTLATATKHMEPLVRHIMAEHGLEKLAPAQAGTKGSFISWILNNSPNTLRTAKRMGESQMVVSFVAIHTTTMTACHALLDLATHPEYITPLREEIERIVEEDGMQQDEDGNPYLTKSSLAKMKLLDSFIKESQRCNPIGFHGIERRVMVDYTFSNGLRLPKNTAISFPIWAVTRSDKTRTFSAEYNENTGNPGPETFDGYRYARLRSVAGRESRHQAVTTGPDSANFGHGPHACPGRFFAIYEIKALLIELLLHYDIRLKDDLESKGGEEKRPQNMANEVSNMPNPMAQLEIKKRQMQ